MSIHWKGACYVVDNIICKVPCETKWNKRQPKLIMRGWATTVKFTKNIATIL